MKGSMSEESLAAKALIDNLSSFTEHISRDGGVINLELKEIARSVDNPEKKPHNDDMTHVTNDLLDARLEAAEARTEARVARIEVMLENSVKNTEKAVEDFRQDSKRTRTVVVTTAISSALAIFFGIAGLIVAMQSNMIGSFDLGSSTRDTISAEVSSQNKALTEKTDNIEAKTNTIEQKLDTLIEAINR